MDSLASKLIILLIGLSISHFLPSGFEKIIIFLFGMLLTFGLEVILLYYYVLTKCSVYNEDNSQKIELTSGNDDIVIDSNRFTRSPKKPLTKFGFGRRLTMINCICSDNKFETLITGTDKVFSELTGHMKELINNQKKFGNGLVKLGEIGLIEKLKSKKSMNSWKNFRKYLLEIGHKFVKDTENLNDNLVQKISSIEKETIKKYKELSQNLSIAGEKFSKCNSEVHKLKTKLASLQSQHRKANVDFEAAKKDLAQFETLVKKEMKLKKISNDISLINNQISVLSAAASEESLIYLPQAVQILKDLDRLDLAYATHYKAFFQGWIEFLLNNFVFSNDCIRKLSEVSQEEETKTNTSTGLNKTFSFIKNTLKSEKVQEKLHLKEIFSSFKSEETPAAERKKLENQIAKVESYGTDMMKFLNLLIANEEEYINEILRILSNWHDITNFYLEEKLTEVKTRTINLFSEMKEYKSQVSLCINQCKIYINNVTETSNALLLNPLSPSDPISGKARISLLKHEYDTLVKESKSSLSLSFSEKFEKSIQVLKSNIEYLSRPEELSFQFEEFNQIAKIHRPQCPYYIPEVQTESFIFQVVEEPKRNGEVESAFWLNDLLNTFISEWRLSPKFNNYIRMKLKKIYNKDNPDYIGEIEVSDVEISDKAPEIKDLSPLQTGNDMEFYYDFELWFRGDVKIHLEFPLKFSVAEMNVSVKVVLRSFYGKVRLFYTPSKVGSSWISFLSEPVHQITMEPVIGKMSKIALSKVPQINSILVSRLSKKIRKYVWPNKKSLKIFKGQKSTFSAD